MAKLSGLPGPSHRTDAEGLSHRVSVLASAQGWAQETVTSTEHGWLGRGTDIEERRHSPAAGQDRQVVQDVLHLIDLDGATALRVVLVLEQPAHVAGPLLRRGRQLLQRERPPALLLPLLLLLRLLLRRGVLLQRLSLGL